MSARSANFHGIDGIAATVATVFGLAAGGVGVHTTTWHAVLERPSLRRVEVCGERRFISLENDWDGPVQWTTAGGGEEALEGPALVQRCRELGLRTIPEITNAIKAGGACMLCHHAPGGLQDLLNEAWGAEAAGAAPAASAPAPLSPYQFGKKIEKTMEDYIRPMLQRDGGDINIVDIKDTVVYCRLGGACAQCAGSQRTLKNLCLLYTSPSPRDRTRSRMPSSA